MQIISKAENEADKQEAERIAKHMCLPLVEDLPEGDKEELMLRFDSHGLALVKGELVLRGDFTTMHKRLKPANLRGELLVRAAKMKEPKEERIAVDATAGMGEDALLLAASGFHVRLYEYNPIIAALLRDALRRAALVPELEEAVSRMQLFEENSVHAMPDLQIRPDVILLDPMFPARQKSGLIKKKFQLIQELEQPCEDAEALMHAAVMAQPHKIIVKRPLKGPNLADMKPNYAIEGKGIRYDCITLCNL